MHRQRSWGALAVGDVGTYAEAEKLPSSGHDKRIAPGLDLAFARAMKKPRKPSSEPDRWTVYMASSKPIWRGKLTYLGSVEARDEAEAREKAIKQLDIRPADQFRITVRRD